MITDATVYCWWDESLKTGRPLGSPRGNDVNLPFFHCNWDTVSQQNGKLNLIKTSQVFILAASKHVWCLAASSCFVGEIHRKIKKTNSPQLVAPAQPCIRHRCVNYWKSVFFSLLQWDQLQEFGCNSIPPPRRRKKSFKLEGDLEINRLMVVWANEGATTATDLPNRSKRKDNLQPAPPLPIRVSSNYPCPVLGPMAENFPEEMGLGNNEQELCGAFFFSWSN